jgi:hypothetical protein
VGDVEFDGVAAGGFAVAGDLAHEGDEEEGDDGEEEGVWASCLRTSSWRMASWTA